MKLRVSAVQYHLHTIGSFDQFAAQVTSYVRTAEEFESDFVLFPELFTTQLMSIGRGDGSGEALKIGELPQFTRQYKELFQGLARETGMHLI